MKTISEQNSTAGWGKRHRVWIPILIGILVPGAWAGVRWLRPDMDQNFRSWFDAAILILAVLLTVMWLLLLSRFSGRARLVMAGVVALLVVAAMQTLKVDGVMDGTGLPRLAWRWQEGRVLDLPMVTESAAMQKEVANVPGAADVRQFFGTERDGRAVTMDIATDWKATPPRELWRQPVGAGWSAFAVVGGRAFTQEQRGDHEVVTCYDLLTGRLIWSHADKAHFTQWQGGEGPRATPTVVDKKVYSYGATGILNCLDEGSGKLIWSRKVLEEAGAENLEWGTSSSPLVTDELVVVTAGKTVGPVLWAFKKADGALAWKAGNDQASYASPVLVKLAERQVILSNNARSLTVHDPATGDIVAEHEWGDLRWPKASQPVVVAGDRVFLSAGYGMGCQLLQVKALADGKLEMTEVWRGLRLKTQFNSAALADGGEHVVGLDDGRLASIDLATGDRLWKEGRFGAGQSLMLGGGLVVIQSEPGPVYLVQAKKEGFAQLAELPALDGKTWNHPTLAGRYLLVRNDREAVCYELPVREAGVDGGS